MTLGIRKLILLGLIGLLILMANLMLVAAWLQETGVLGWASWVRETFLTPTAITVLVALLILLVSPGGAWKGGSRRCAVCGYRGPGVSNYCCECGSCV